MQFEVPSPSAQTWIQELRSSLTTAEQLYGAGLISELEANDPHLDTLVRDNQVRITPHYASLIDRLDPACPIRLQALPSLARETDPVLPAWLQHLCGDIYGTPAPWRDDAIGDLTRLAAPRLTHRYGNRALLHVSDNCAVWCRFCFRKSHLNEREESLYAGHFDEAIDYLMRTPRLTELILTGGDPLSLGDEPLARLLGRLDEVPHLKNVRIHTRMPVTLPSRVTASLASILGSARTYHLSLSNHFNHPRELCVASHQALRRLREAGITLLNQSVLLRGVNDSTATLTRLFQGLYEAGVIPFWLHHPDLTPTTFGFRVSIQRGLQLYRELFGQLSGPALPHYVLDLPSGLGKAPLNDARIRLVHSEARDGYQVGVYELPLPNTQYTRGDETTRYLDITIP
jgi:lysine 2,3-aminomutase